MLNVSVTLPPSIDGGGVITMRKFTTRDLLAILKRELSNVELLELTIAAIVEYLPGKDPLDLAPDEVSEILDAWMAAAKEAALPPVTAPRSVRRSRARRSAKAPS